MPRLPQPVIKQNRIKQKGQPRCGCPFCLIHGGIFIKRRAG